MGRSAKHALKLARFTRRYSRHGTPLRYRFARWLVKRRYSEYDSGPGVQLVVDYDEGQIQVDTPSKIEHTILFHGYHEPEMARLIKRLVRPGHTCLDVGANVGTHTLLMAFAAGAAGRVISLEPHPDLRQRLAENVALNGLDSVTLVPAALSDADGEATLYTFADDMFNRGCSSLRPTVETKCEMTIRTLTGRTLTAQAQIDRCDLIKIDVEGHELVALRQLADLIELHRPVLLFEYGVNYWQAHDAALADALALARGWGYVLFTVKDDVTCPLVEDPTSNCDILCVPPARVLDV